MTAAGDEPPPPSNPRLHFLLAYLFWLVTILAIGVGLWLSSSGLTAFRYAGF